MLYEETSQVLARQNKDQSQNLSSKLCASERTDSLSRHEITPQHRAKMVDWMIEVMATFKQQDRTFFLAVSVMDRFFKNSNTGLKVGDLHLIGITAMYLASKAVDTHPLSMTTVHEQIAHKLFEEDQIRDLACQMVIALDYDISNPTALDYLKQHLAQILDITLADQVETKRKTEKALAAMSTLDDKTMADEEDAEDWAVDLVADPNQEESNDAMQAQLQSFFIEKLAVYLAKLAQHDVTLATRDPIALSIGCISVALEMNSSLKRQNLLTEEVGKRIIEVSELSESVIVEISKLVLHLAQNSGQELPGLKNLNQHDFSIIVQLI